MILGQRVLLAQSFEGFCDGNQFLVTEFRDQASQPEPPAIRRVIRVPAISGDLFPPDDPDKILIKAQPTTTGDQCLFMLNRALFPGYSWWFPNFESASDSPLAERLFSLNDVETVLINESTVAVTRKDKTVCDWKILAEERQQHDESRLRHRKSTRE